MKTGGRCGQAYHIDCLASAREGEFCPCCKQTMNIDRWPVASYEREDQEVQTDIDPTPAAAAMKVIDSSDSANVDIKFLGIASHAAFKHWESQTERADIINSCTQTENFVDEAAITSKLRAAEQELTEQNLEVHKLRSEADEAVVAVVQEVRNEISDWTCCFSGLSVQLAEITNKVSKLERHQKVICRRIDGIENAQVDEKHSSKLGEAAKEKENDAIEVISRMSTSTMAAQSPMKGSSRKGGASLPTQSPMKIKMPYSPGVRFKFSFLRFMWRFCFAFLKFDATNMNSFLIL